MCKHFDLEIQNSKESVSELTTHLNTTTTKVIQDEKTLWEAGVIQGEIHSIVRELAEGHKKSTQSIKDVQFSMDGQYNVLIGKTKMLNGKSIYLSKRLKKLDDSVSSLDEIVHFCIIMDNRDA